MSALIAGIAACTPEKPPEGPLAIDKAEFRPPLGATGIGAGYFTIRSAADDKIIAVTSPAADLIEIHASVTKDNRVTMQRVETLDLPAGKTVRFEPGSYHLMVFSPRTSPSQVAFPITIQLQSGAREIVAFKIVTGGGNHPG